MTKLRHLLQQEGLLKVAKIQGDLFVEKNGRRKLWKRNVSDSHAARMIEDWEDSPQPPMMEGADAILVSQDGEYLYADGWERM